MIVQIILLIVGFIILIKGADIFVDGASGVAKNFKVSKMLIGLTIVAFGTCFYSHIYTYNTVYKNVQVHPIHLLNYNKHLVHHLNLLAVQSYYTLFLYPHQLIQYNYQG